MPKAAHLQPELLTYLTQLKKNNNRQWFQKNKNRYETEVRDPLLHFIEAFAPRLKNISPHFIADARKTGGSLFRIYRDTRFSHDKRPYKTHAGVQFRHERAKDVHAPGFYLHIEPKQAFVGVGIWHPDSDTLKLLRDAIVENPAKWKRAKSAKAFNAEFELAGDSLKRAPKGYDPDHPLIEDLRRKDFIAVTKLKDKDLVAPAFLDRFTKTCTAAKPFMRFLAEACGLEW
jgi:uncharacterized protein (TIGR02453 family)